MIAVKDNREYDVNEVNMEDYRKRGYDIYDNGVLIAYGAGRTVSMEKYRMLEKRYENLMAENARLVSELESSKKKGKKQE